MKQDTSGPAPFRRKPLVISATLNVAAPVDSPDREPLLAWLEEKCDDWVQRSDGSIVIGTLEGPLRASPGDWIIRGIRGEFYSCKPDIFNEMYEPADGGVSETAARDDAQLRLVSLLQRVRAMYSGYGLINHGAVDTTGFPQWQGERAGTLIADIDNALWAAEATDRKVTGNRDAIIVHSSEQLSEHLETIAYPVEVQPGFTYNGQGRGIAYDPLALSALVEIGLQVSPTCEVRLIPASGGQSLDRFPAAVPEKEEAARGNSLETNLQIVEAMLQFAYENGYHELGYDPLKELVQQLTAFSPKRAGPREVAAEIRSLVARIEAAGERSHWKDLLPHLRSAIEVLERLPQVLIAKEARHE